jgi:hypothetical protein
VHNSWHQLTHFPLAQQSVEENTWDFQQAWAVLKRNQQPTQNTPFAVGHEPRWAWQQRERQTQYIARERPKRDKATSFL